MDIYSADGEDYRVVRNIYLFAVDGQRGNKLLNGVLLAGIIGIGAVVGLILRLIVGFVAAGCESRKRHHNSCQ